MCSSEVCINSNIIPPATKNYNGIPLCSIKITDEMVMDKLKSLNPGKSTGPDGWHPYLLLCLADELYAPLRILYNKSLIEGVLPSQWLEACITAIHKKGLKSEITSVICKIMESIIRDHNVTYMSSNKLFSTAQHGFVPSRNCMTNLLLSMEDWAAALEYGYSIDIIYTDFAKAFDPVPHKRLFAKLQSIGVQGQLLRWTEAFLTGRRHRVSLSGELSNWTDVTSGIPQGSVLGPILFVIFLNDMPNVVKNCCKLFADDAKLYRPVLSEADTQSLQSDINILMEWSSTWQLPFNEMKCKRMHLGRGNNSRPYHMNDHILENVTEEKNLGVTVDHQLKFHTHTSAAIKKANSILGLIKRSFSVKDKSTLPSLYMSMVRPHLEYGNTIWGPHFKQDMKAIERVQKRATRMIPTLKDRRYTERLKALDLPSLEYRRKRGDMFMYYKIMTGKVEINRDKLFTLNQHSTRGHRFKIQKTQRATKLVRCQSFAIRSANDWNSLPAEVVEAKSANEFKNLLDKHWRDRRYVSPFT